MKVNPKSVEPGKPPPWQMKLFNAQNGLWTRKKWWMQFYLWGAITALLLLVSALPQMVLQPGFPLDSSPAILMPLRFIWLAIIFLLFLFLILIPRSLYSRILPGLLLLMVLLPLTLWGLEQFLTYTDLGQRLSDLRGDRPLVATPPEEAASDLPPVAAPPDLDLDMTPPPALTRLPWLNYLLTVAVLLLGLLVIIGAIGWFWQRPSPDNEETVLPDLAREAEAALEALRGGGTLSDVVMRCYLEMERVLYETRGTARPQYSTPHEFAAQLLKLGLPASPVNSLTHLFEQARYGQTHPDSEQQGQAISSLEAIIQACQRQR